MNQDTHPYKRLLPYFKPHIWIIGLALLFSVAVNIGHLGQLSAISPFLHKIIARTDIIFTEGAKVPGFLAAFVAKINAMEASTVIYFLIGWIIIVAVIRVVSEYFAAFFLNMASEKLMRDIRNKVYGKLLGLSLNFYSKSSTGELVSKITYDVTVLKNSISQGVMDLIREPLMIVANLGAIIFCKAFFPIPWRLILVPLALFLIVIYPVMAIGKKLRKIAQQGLDKMGDINRVLYETISGIRIVKAFSMERYEAGRFNKENKQFYKITMKSIARMLALRPITEFVEVLSIAIFFWFIRGDILSGGFPIGAFGISVAALLFLMKPIKKLSRVYGIHQQAMAASTRLFELMDMKVAITEKEGASKLPIFNEKVAFNNVRFSYEDNIILKDVNLNLKKGEIVAIVGPSGVGKTTLVNLIPRFYDVTNGSIKIDDTDVRDVTLNSLWGQIGLVTQDTILFNDTVIANIAYGKQDAATKNSVIKAAKIANAHDFITNMPHGYNTVIGEAGFRLSGGEKQRLAIARAVLKNPPILILDEATSQLDTESERLVQSALDRLMKGRTVFIIAHRLSTVKGADKIIVLHKSTIAEEGTHEGLMRKKGLYSRLYDMQFKGL